MTDFSSQITMSKDWHQRCKYQFTFEWTVGSFLPLLLFQIDGEWVTTAIAADNVDKIDKGGPLRIYVRKLTCNERCLQMEITFYVE